MLWKRVIREFYDSFTLVSSARDDFYHLFKLNVPLTSKCTLITISILPSCDSVYDRAVHIRALDAARSNLDRLGHTWPCPQYTGWWIARSEMCPSFVLRRIRYFHLSLHNFMERRYTHCCNRTIV